MNENENRNFPGHGNGRLHGRAGAHAKAGEPKGAACACGPNSTDADTFTFTACHREVGAEMSRHAEALDRLADEVGYSYNRLPGDGVTADDHRDIDTPTLDAIDMARRAVDKLRAVADRLMSRRPTAAETIRQCHARHAGASKLADAILGDPAAVRAEAEAVAPVPPVNAEEQAAELAHAEAVPGVGPGSPNFPKWPYLHPHESTRRQIAAHAAFAEKLARDAALVEQFGDLTGPGQEHATPAELVADSAKELAAAVRLIMDLLPARP